MSIDLKHSRSCRANDQKAFDWIWRVTRLELGQEIFDSMLPNKKYTIQYFETDETTNQDVRFSLMPSERMYTLFVKLSILDESET